VTGSLVRVRVCNNITAWFREYGVEKSAKVRGRDLIYDTVSTFTWAYWGKRRKSWVSATGVHADIRTPYLPNAM
jgi:hypothetical protein